MKAEEARFIQATIAGRQKFYNPEQRAMYSALMAQARPALDKLRHTPASHSLEHLIKEVPIKDAFKKLFKNVGSYFAAAQYHSLITNKSQRIILVKSFNDDIQDSIDEYIDNDIAQYVTNITDYTRRKIKDFVADAIKNGTPTSELESVVLDNYSKFSKIRAMTIARTEIGRASNWGAQEASEMLDMNLVKTWLHAGNSKMDRDTHVEASGQTVDNDDDFDIDEDYTPYFPQDGSGGADEEANCNCCAYRGVKH